VSPPMSSEPLTDDLPAAPAPPAVTGAKGAVEIVEPTRAQRTLARRVAESKATIPDVQLTLEVDVTDLLAANDADADGAFIKAAALALREHPRANGAYQDAAFQQHGRVNVGVTLMTADALVVPTVFDADAKSVAAIAEDVRRLTAKVDDGTITSADLAGGTFTLTSLAGLGVTAFTTIISPGQAASLAIGAPVERVALDAAGTPTVRRIATLTLSCDHRIFYGADAAAFLGRIRALLEAPAALLA
jgi:pyruvate dehydrogenase E2 component (dihydrolipoamide acetyltransferase)